MFVQKLQNMLQNSQDLTFKCVMILTGRNKYVLPWQVTPLLQAACPTNIYNYCTTTLVLFPHFTDEIHWKK